MTQKAKPSWFIDISLSKVTLRDSRTDQILLPISDHSYIRIIDYL